MNRVKTPQDWYEAERKKELVGDEPIPDNIPLPELAEQVVRGKVKLTPAQMRMLVGYMTNDTFA